MRQAILICLALVTGCATKPVCINGNESFRPVLDPGNSCKVRIRQVLIGTDVKIPPSVAIDGGKVSWGYDWVESEFKNGQVEMGHFILKPQTEGKK